MIRHNSKTTAIALLLLLPTLLFGGVRATGSSLISTMPIHRFLQLNGTTQYAYVADNDILDPRLDDIGCGGWFKTSTNYSAAPGMILNKRTSNTWFNVSIGTTNKLDISISDSTNRNSVLSVTTVNDGLWHHYFYIFDRSSGLSYLWLDGGYNNKSSVRAVGDVNTVSQLHIGKQSTGDLRYFNGQLDEIRFYKFGINGLYVTGTFGSSGIIRVGDATGDLIWSDAAPTTSLIYKLYDKPYATLTQLGFPSIDNANQTNLITDSYDWPDSNSDGLANNWINYSSTVADGTPSIVTGSGFSGNAQQITKNKVSGSTIGLRFNHSGLTIGQYYTLNFKYIKSSAGKTLSCQFDTYALRSTFNTDQATATQYSVTVKATTAASVIVWFIDGVPANGDYFAIDEVSLTRVGEITRWKFDTSLLDTNINGLNLTGVGSPAYGKAGLRAQ